MKQDFQTVVSSDLRTLDIKHRDHLKITAGLSDEFIDCLDIFSATPEQAKLLCGTDKPGLVFPYCDLSGNTIGHRIRLDEPFDDRKYHQKLGSSLTAYFPGWSVPSILSANKDLIIVEGEKKVLAVLETVDAEKYSALAIPGCWNYLAPKSEKNDAKTLSPILAKIPLRNRRVIFIPDSDFFQNPNVYRAGCTLIDLLHQRGAHVDLIDLRVDSSTTKIGADDFIVTNGKDAFLQKLMKPAWTWISNTLALNTVDTEEDNLNRLLRSHVLLSDLRIEQSFKAIKTTTKINLTSLRSTFKKIRIEWDKFCPLPKSKADEILWDKENESIPRLFKQVGQALNNDTSMFVSPSTNSLIRVNPDLHQFKVISDGRDLSSELMHSIHFKRGTWKSGVFKSTNGYEPIPATHLDSMLRVIGRYTELRPLKFFSKSPICISDQLVMEPGYCEDLGVYYAGSKIEPKYTTELLDKLLSTFPFVDDVSRVNALGALLMTTFFLDQFTGAHPLVLVQGNSPNLGKTTLIKTIVYIASGQIPNTLTFPSDDQELEKRLATEVQDSNYVAIDNVKSNVTVSSAVLERCLTDQNLNFRRLGYNSRIHRPNNVGFFMTLNDGHLSRDLCERVLPIFMSDLEIQKMDQDFEPLDFIAENREELLSELVGMVKTWELQSCRYHPIVFPKFKKFAACLNGVLLANGYGGFLRNYGDLLTKLDPINSGLLEVALREIESSYRSETESRFPSEWRKIIEFNSSNAFEDAINEHGRNTIVGNRLARLLGRFLQTQSSDGTVKRLRLEAEENLSKVGGNRRYKFTLWASEDGTSAPPPDNSGV